MDLHPPPFCVRSPLHQPSKSFPCHSYRISALCCKVRVRNSVSISRLRTLSFSVSCNPCICHSYENCRVCTNNSHFETRRRDFRHRNEKLVPANPLESAFANCDTCKSPRMRFYENCQVSLVSISSDLRFSLNFLPSVRRSSRRGFGH